jgi:ribosomal protein S18 acetylase RimI-like enzyme
MPKVTLRPVEPGDESFLERVYGSTRADELAQVPWTDEQKAAFVRHQFTAQTAHYAEHYTGMTSEVVLVDGEPAGRLLVARWSEEIRIVDISLLPEFRGRGTGTGLLRGLVDEARDAGKRLSIHVEVHNPAMRLYERLGFRPAGDAGVYLLMALDPQVKIAS